MFQQVVTNFRIATQNGTGDVITAVRTKKMFLPLSNVYHAAD
jgi:hypothetical protein